MTAELWLRRSPPDENAAEAARQTVTDSEIRALLDRYRCPVPFHAVGTRFFGSIAFPRSIGSA